MNTRTIVTGSSSNHFPCLKNLLYTIRKLASDADTVVFDLGLSDRERNALAADGWEVRPFEFAKYPSHVNIAINRGEYAWKPIIIHTILKEVGGLVLWLDAGNLVLADLNPIWDAIAKNGLVSVLSGATIRDWTHPSTLAYLEVPEEDLGRLNRAGGVIGMSGDHEWARRLCAQWYECALCKECIAPKGSSRKNHRQDQAVLSVLYYRYHREVGFPKVDRVAQIAVHNDDLHRGDVQLLLRSSKVQLRTLTLFPRGSLGDRLLALASAARVCALTRATCVIAWDAGDFDSLFRPPKGVTWTSVAAAEAARRAPDHTISFPPEDGSGDQQIPVSIHHTLLVLAQGSFNTVGEPKLAKIDRLRKWLPQPSAEIFGYARSIVRVPSGRTAGMHIARKCPFGNYLPPLDDYFRIAEALIDQDTRIFLVAHPEVARQMTARFGDHILQCPSGDLPVGQAAENRETRSLAFEVVEFFMLAQCDYIIGDAESPYSSLAILYNGSSHCQIFSLTPKDHSLTRRRE